MALPFRNAMSYFPGGYALDLVSQSDTPLQCFQGCGAGLITMILDDSDLETPYTREEILNLGHSPPERGLLCPKCGARIPQFLDLKESDSSRVHMLIRDSRRMMAMGELRAATGCSIAWAKLWVSHPGRPEWDRGVIEPCPFCGEPLRTPLARQCRHCLMDWHDKRNPVTLL